MKKYLLFILLAVSLSAYPKPPKAVNNVRNSVVSIIAYKNGELLRNGLGVFINNTEGEVISSHSLFIDADSAVTIDSRGIIRPINKVLGADELYDCIRLSVNTDKKLKTVEYSSQPARNGDLLYMVSYGMKKSGTIEEVTIKETDTISGSHLYYKTNLPAKHIYTSAPLVNANGELVALIQPIIDNDTSHSYAIAANYIKSLSIKASNYNSERFTRIGIKKALPSTEEEALSCLLLQSFSSDTVAYKSILNEFIKQFPQNHQGYLYSAEYNAVKLRNYDIALNCWENAFSLTEKDDEIYYHKANIIYTHKLYSDSSKNNILTLDSALSYTNKAIKINNQPIYTQLKGNILYTKRDFTAAFDCYSSLTNTNLCNAELFVLAANCKEYLGDNDAAIAYLDSAIATFGRVPIAAMAPYVMNRGLVKYRAKRYREAILDYNIYANLLNNRVNANFYYLREQAEYNGKMYRQALADIDVAIHLSPQNILFLLEKGRICYRVNMIDEALSVLETAKNIEAENPDVYYLLARCQIIKGDKTTAKENLAKAIKYGHPTAATTLKELK